MTERNKKGINKDKEVDERPGVTREAQVFGRTMGDLARATNDQVFRQQLLDENAADQIEDPQKETPAK